MLVKPWWLYRDYRSARALAAATAGWRTPDPQYKPVESLLNDADGKPVIEIRVCREEAQTRRDRAHLRERPHQGAPQGREAARRRFRPAPARPAVRDGAQGRARRLRHADGARLRARLRVRRRASSGASPSDSEQRRQRVLLPEPHAARPGHAARRARRSSRAAMVPYWWSREAVRFLGDLFGERPRLPRDPHRARRPS